MHEYISDKVMKLLYIFIALFFRFRKQLAGFSRARFSARRIGSSRDCLQCLQSTFTISFYAPANTCSFEMLVQC